MNGLTAGFENMEELHKAAAGMHGAALRAAPPQPALSPQHPTISWSAIILCALLSSQNSASALGVVGLLQEKQHWIIAE